MLYLLDANVLIDAHRDYYPIDRVPEFWSWLEHQGSNGHIKMPIEIYEEVTAGKGELPEWLQEDAVELALQLMEVVDEAVVAKVVDDGYAADLTDIEVQKIGRDPFLISTAMKDIDARCVVTTEPSKPSTIRANRRVPDVCKQFGVECVNTFELLRALDFSTSWKRK